MQFILPTTHLTRVVILMASGLFFLQKSCRPSAERQRRVCFYNFFIRQLFFVLAFLQAAHCVMSKEALKGGCGDHVECGEDISKGYDCILFKKFENAGIRGEMLKCGLNIILREECNHVIVVSRTS